ncbi:MAG: thymidylate kinase, partial [Metallosphaera sp.]
EEEWMNYVLSALPPANLSLGLVSSPREIMRRILKKKGVLDPLSSGIDICINGELFSSYETYLNTFQDYLRKVIQNGVIVDTSRNFEVVKSEIATIVGDRIEKA